MEKISYINPDEKIKTVIAEKLFEGCEAALKEVEKIRGESCDNCNQAYITYFCFSVLGSLLLENLGLKEFKRIVREIIEIEKENEK